MCVSEFVRMYVRVRVYICVRAQFVLIDVNGGKVQMKIPGIYVQEIMWK